MTAPGKPLDSVITPVYNGGPYLEPLIASVHTQDYPSIEHIVIDDGSTDGGATVEILKQHPHLRWWSRENRGHPRTVNEGLAAARGDVLCVINADDLLVPGAVGRAVATLEAGPGLSLVYGRVLIVDERGQALPFENFVEPSGPFSRAMLRRRSCIYHCSMYVRRELVVGRGIWLDPGFRHLLDWDWICRIMDTGCGVGFIDAVMSCFRMHAAQITQSTLPQRWHAEFAEICKRNGVSLALGLGVQRLYRYRHRVLRFAWLLRTGGPRLVLERFRQRRARPR
jgi:glycosyltransferase involved in cell wall biosynthesis